MADEKSIMERIREANKAYTTGLDEEGIEHWVTIYLMGKGYTVPADVTIMQASTNHTVDFVLALVLLIGSTLGAQFGATISRKLKGDQLKIILATLVLVVMVKMLLGLLLRPHVLLAFIGGH